MGFPHFHISMCYLNTCLKTAYCHLFTDLRTKTSNLLTCLCPKAVKMWSILIVLKSAPRNLTNKPFNKLAIQVTNTQVSK